MRTEGERTTNQKMAHLEEIDIYVSVFISLLGLNGTEEIQENLNYSNIYVLGIESSFDDTSAAVVSDSGKVLGESHFSQSRIHVECGGVVARVASNLHRQYIKSVVDTSLQQSSLNFKDINAVAVTVKPGMQLSLEAGTDYAKDLCTLYRKPLIPIHHMEAHALTARMLEEVKFPFLVFLISGGHSLLALAQSIDKFYTLGTSLDGTPGQIFDKVAIRAKLRNLKKYSGLVGGVAIEKAALDGDITKFYFPNHVLQKNRDCNFTFSGFRTLATQHIQNEEKKHDVKPDEVIPTINDVCAGFQFAVTRHLCQRLEVAINYVKMKDLLKDNEKCLVVSGGVASNGFIRNALKLMCDYYEYKMVVPPPKLCTDNGIMVAWNGIERLRENFPTIHPDNLASVQCEVKCPLGEDISGDVKSAGRQMGFKYLKLLKLIKKQEKYGQQEVKQERIES